jgi:hypothetical protein
LAHTPRYQCAVGRTMKNELTNTSIVHGVNCPKVEHEMIGNAPRFGGYWHGFKHDGPYIDEQGGGVCTRCGRCHERIGP